MAASFVVRLRNLMNIVRDCQLLREAIADGRDPDSLGLAYTPDASSPAVLHRDHGHALWSAAATALSVLACCAFWIASGWTDGATAPLFAAVLGSLLAGADDTTFLLFGWLAARPTTARLGSMLAIYTSVQLALNSSYSADFSSFANSSVALMLGIGLTGVISSIVRLFGAAWIADRLLRSNWKTLATAADGKTRHDRVALASLMQHRLALLAARISVVPAEARSHAANLRQLRAALSLIDLRQASLGLSGRTRTVIDALLARLASVCRVHQVGRLPDELIGRLDSTVASTLQEPASEERDETLVGLAGIRAGLFPEAAPYEPHVSEQRRVAA
jgi:uncharacterized membrane protein YccC